MPPFTQLNNNPVYGGFSEYVEAGEREKQEKEYVDIEGGKIADITGSFPYNSYHLIALREMAIKIGFFRAT